MRTTTPTGFLRSSSCPATVEQLCPPGSTFPVCPSNEGELGKPFQTVCFKKNFPEKYLLFILLLVVLGIGEFFMLPFKSQMPLSECHDSVAS